MPPTRQLNVQQQNTVTEAGICREASYWRQHGVPEALKIAGLERGIQWERAIIIDMDIDFPGMPPLFGTLLTQEEKFIYFEIDTDESHRVLERVGCWEDVSGKQNTNAHNRGVGAGLGALAIKVLLELNA